MKITMITGSARKTGTSAYLSENFARVHKMRGMRWRDLTQHSWMFMHALGVVIASSHAEKCIF